MFQHFNPYSNQNHTVPNPGCPYEGDIPNGLQPGKQIHVSGHVPHHSTQFRFDLKTYSGIALCINPRFNQGTTVRNSEQNGGWANEELGPIPFHKGRNFTMVITVEHDKYRVEVNGMHAFDFRHRTSFHDVKRFGISGDITIHQINYSGGAGSAHHEQGALNVPGAVAIRSGMQPGRMIQIQGSVFPNAGRFQINLQSTGEHDPANMAFVFNPRWNDPSGQQIVVRTNKQHGGWGPEERDGYNPFTKGGNFDMLILCEPNEYKVAVNGQHFTSFRHRANMQEVNHIGVSGDVSIRSVKIY